MFKLLRRGDRWAFVIGEAEVSVHDTYGRAIEALVA